VRVTTKVTSATGVPPTGTVRITAVNGTIKIVRSVRLGAGGTAVLDLGPLTRKGTYKITAAYLGSATVNGFDQRCDQGEGDPLIRA
jgi:Bacterial Ig-like domain (group 3)